MSPQAAPAKGSGAVRIAFLGGLGEIGRNCMAVEVGGAGHNDVTRPNGLTSPVRLRGDDIYAFVLP